MELRISESRKFQVFLVLGFYPSHAKLTPLVLRVVFSCAMYRTIKQEDTITMWDIRCVTLRLSMKNLRSSVRSSLTRFGLPFLPCYRHNTIAGDVAVTTFIQVYPFRRLHSRTQTDSDFVLAGYLNIHHSLRIRSRRHATSRGRRFSLPVARYTVCRRQGSRSRSSEFTTFETLENVPSATRVGEGTTFLFGKSCKRCVQFGIDFQGVCDEVVLELMER